MLPLPRRCSFPGCTAFGDHDHHITYEPPVIKALCRKHHEDITIINGAQSRRCGTLRNNQRWAIWFKWRAGELKPRRTKLAMDWIQAWDMKTDQNTLSRIPVVQESLPVVKKKARHTRSTAKKKRSSKKTSNS